ncbi:MAG: hypothetical protein KatS3mg119_1064 [Rhodothalassiaceae bacterium]|nr:MAG: hypothetical protein KatS3mg119_1064 [Rhodothalassiaceae bacterium]
MTESRSRTQNHPERPRKLWDRDPGLAALLPVRPETSVPWEGGRRLRDWWYAARADRLMPAWRDFSPRAMGRWLSGVIVFRVVGGSDEPDFIVRLAGEDYRRTAGTGLKGQALAVFPDAEPIRARFLWALAHRLPYMALDLPSHWAGKDFVRFRSLVVPLGDECGRVDHLVGHAHYFIARNGPRR